MAGWLVVVLMIAWVLAVSIDAWLERCFREVAQEPGTLRDRITFITQIGTAAGQAAAERVSDRRRRLYLLAHWRERSWQTVGGASLLIGGISLVLPDGLIVASVAAVPFVSWIGQAPLTALAGLGLPAGLFALVTSRQAFGW